MYFELRRAACLSALIAFIAICASAHAATKPTRTAVAGAPPKSILFVGNSFFYYNNSMHNQVLELARSADAANKGGYRYTSVTISGSGVVFNKFDKPFDAAILNDCSQCPVHPQLKATFHEYAKKHSDTVRKHGAQPVFFMTWAYKDKPEMTAQLAEEYTLAGNANDVLVIPAGLAFAKAISKRPELELYQPDKRHPSAIGTYLAACTIYASIYGKSPAGNSFKAGVDDKTAAFLQAIAWETVQEYYAR
jgi:hypothetical protein